jgi:hypothetical protein
VVFADGCEDRLVIPETGGFFQGNTANAFPDFSAGCDTGAFGDNAADQILEFEISEPRRVFFETQGSGYPVLLNLRSGSECPGSEIVGGCAASSRSGGTFLDIELDAGKYFVQIDGVDGEEGAWFLDVFEQPP